MSNLHTLFVIDALSLYCGQDITYPKTNITYALKRYHAGVIKLDVLEDEASGI